MDIFEQVAEWRRLDGIEEGRSVEKENSIRLFLANTEFSPEKIASLVEVPLALVQKKRMKCDPNSIVTSQR